MTASLEAEDAASSFNINIQMEKERYENQRFWRQSDDYG